MPKSLLVDPAKVRQKGLITFETIPVNAYEADPVAEKAEYGEDGLVEILRQMLLIREFETMLNDIKTLGSYAGIEYNHRGPAHLSIGQESTAVGACYVLKPEDMVFGSHRSHGEILAKCFSAASSLEDDALQRTMESYLDGDILRAVESHGSGAGGATDLAAVAEQFILYGTLAEIFARKNGFNRGLGGSMHAFFAPFGSMPNNAIVGGSAIFFGS